MSDQILNTLKTAGNYNVVTTNETFITDTTTFKMVVFFSHKVSGVAFSVYEKQQNKNRRYVDSYDYIVTVGGKTQTRHDLAYKKLGLFYNDHLNSIQSAILFFNDFENKKQHKIAVLYNNKARNIQACIPTFADPDENGNVRVNGWAGNPIRSYELVNKTIEYSKVVTNRIILK